MASEDVVHADPNEVGMYEIESLCMNCEDNVRPTNHVIWLNN